jgi:ABC-type sugar transport system ATPase subunit
MADVRLSHVTKHYGDVEALSDVSLQVKEGEFCVFVGPSGCGKSTLLRSIAGLEGISSGAIVIGEEEVTHVPPSDRGVAMVFQSYALYPHMSVRENMEFGMKINGVDRNTRSARVAEAARILQLEDYLDRKPAQLSGGQRQRVAIGRAIVKEPKVFLFDEPLSNLDAKLRIQMRVELEALHSKLGATMIYVTHDQVEAMTMADTIVVLNAGQVEQIGSPMDLYHRPATEFVADFIGAPAMNFLDVHTEGAAVKYHHEPIVLPASAPRGAVRLGIRPEHVVLGTPGEGAFDAKVEVREALGGETFLYTTAPGGERVVVKTAGDDATRTGEMVGLVFPPEKIHLFGADGANLSLAAREAA